MKAGYYKDSMHNYMVLLSGEENESEDYRYRMITHNRIQGTLPVSIRYIDGKRYLYYEITSRQSLDTLLGRQSLTRNELESMLSCLVDVKERLAEYLLDPVNLLLEPEYIFYDLREKKYLYTYYPDCEERSMERKFLNELASHVEKNDREAVRLIYKLCGMAENPEFSLRKEELYEEELYDDISYASGEVKGDELSKNSMPSGKSGFSEETLPPSYRKMISENDGFSEDMRFQKGSFSDRIKEKAEGSPETEGKRGSFIPFVFWGAAVLLLVLRCTANMNNRGGRVCMVLSIFGALLGTVLFYVEKREAAAEENENGEEAGTEEEPASRRRSDTFSEITSDRSSTIHSTKRPEENLHFIRKSSSCQEYGMWAESCNSTDIERTRPEELLDAETVYLAHCPDPEYRLAGTGRWSTLVIELDSFPCVIGKLESYVDAVVDDRSVSRIHARISKDEEEHLIIQDLNSTNGTWVGSRRLEPNEVSVISENQLIRFGRVEFKLRES